MRLKQWAHAQLPDMKTLENGAKREFKADGVGRVLFCLLVERMVFGTKHALVAVEMGGWSSCRVLPQLDKQFWDVVRNHGISHCLQVTQA